jgi:alanyl-tRNA synthetase
LYAESAVAAGVRRIEAITGVAAENISPSKPSWIDQLKELLKNPKDLQKALKACWKKRQTEKRDRKIVSWKNHQA